MRTEISSSEKRLEKERWIHQMGKRIHKFCCCYSAISHQFLIMKSTKKIDLSNFKSFAMNAETLKYIR